MKFELPSDTSNLSPEDLLRLTGQVFVVVKKLLRRCVDADVTFMPVDKLASDPAAASGQEQDVAWTLGHIIVHMTASAEEAATVAAELARGVSYHGRSRYEVPWDSITTVAVCLARLQESYRLCCASLDMWPDQPHLENTYVFFPGMPDQGPIECFLNGLRHDAAHLDHLRDVIAQARAYRKQHTLLGRWRSARAARHARRIGTSTAT